MASDRKQKKEGGGEGNGNGSGKGKLTVVDMAAKKDKDQRDYEKRIKLIEVCTNCIIEYFERVMLTFDTDLSSFIAQEQSISKLQVEYLTTLYT